jgi:hypothetical protein
LSHKIPKKNVPVGGQFAPLRILVFSTKNTVSIGVSASQKIKINLMTLSERDSSGTTVGLNEMKPEGDGADSPTRAKRSGSPKFYLLSCKNYSIFGYYLSIQKQYEKVYFVFLF